MKILDAGQVYEFTKGGEGTVSANRPVLLVQIPTAARPSILVCKSPVESVN